MKSYNQLRQELAVREIQRSQVEARLDQIENEIKTIFKQMEAAIEREYKEKRNDA